MVKALIKRGADGEIKGFTMRSHASGMVCAAASALAINAVNSIEKLTSAKADVRYPKNGDGYLDYAILEREPQAELLLRSFALGLSSIKEEHPDEIKIDDKFQGGV